MISKMAMVCKPGQMGANTKDLIVKAKRVAKVSIHGKMAAILKATGKTTK